MLQGSKMWPRRCGVYPRLCGGGPLSHRSRCVISCIHDTVKTMNTIARCTSLDGEIVGAISVADDQAPRVIVANTIASVVTAAVVNPTPTMGDAGSDTANPMVQGLMSILIGRFTTDSNLVDVLSHALAVAIGSGMSTVVPTVTAQEWGRTVTSLLMAVISAEQTSLPPAVVIALDGLLQRPDVVIGLGDIAIHVCSDVVVLEEDVMKIWCHVAAWLARI